MIDLFHEIKDTLIPTLLVVGGLVLLILAVVEKITGRIEVPPTYQKASHPFHLVAHAQV